MTGSPKSSVPLFPHLFSMLKRGALDIKSNFGKGDVFMRLFANLHSFAVVLFNLRVLFQLIYFFNYFEFVITDAS